MGSRDVFGSVVSAISDVEHYQFGIVNVFGKPLGADQNLGSRVTCLFLFRNATKTH